ncbi:Prim_Pol domain containing protein [uncultured Caudovirales phage]|uniref:Prim_Pol domain containing protein n=1 Tax=uncultured Caudovirales phage TaxID=2100421 RepID=A0A6J5N5G2_9CAUD|nr:Prim_Pol domain containing protein [uncultured Caudovirales phage]
MASKKESTFAAFAWKFIERGISVVPIAPGTKKPGQWSEQRGWEGMSDWTRFASRLPTELELEFWNSWPEAGIGVVLGAFSKLVGLDKDYDLPDGNDALSKLIPYSPVSKKGEKGWTRFYLYNGEKSCSFDVNGVRVLDVLSDGRQTVVPPTAHPSGCSYVWITPDALDTITNVTDLPKLPDDFLAQVERVLAPYQTEGDKKFQKKPVAHRDDGKINTELSIQAQYFRDLNRQALDRLEEWVPKIIPTAKQERGGWRCIAIWRQAKNHNVGIDPHGIRDWGGNYGMTAIDLVMYANGLTFGKAAESLRACLALSEPEPIVLNVGTGAVTAATTPRASAPAALPWNKPQPAPVMLPPQTSIDPAPAIPNYINNPPGILGEIARWITQTAPKAQPELSVAAAIALCSVVMGRTYRSQFGNRTSLYLVMVAKSTEGKEHPQQCVEKVLTAAHLETLIGGSGYTSAGAVYSALLKSPAHIATIDEIGKLLKMSRAKGNAHAEAALDKLVEAFGRQDGILRPPTYSTMTMKDAQKPAERVIHNPAITMLGATTPGTFYENLTTDLIKDGFLGRCIVVESQQPRQLTRFVDRTDPPARVVDWCQAVHVSGAAMGNLSDVVVSEAPPSIIALPFSESCLPLMEAFESELNDAKTAGEGEGLDVLLGRSLEKALKLAMIAAKADDPGAREVKPTHFEWAIDYVRHYDNAMVRAVRRNRVESVTDADLKRAIEFIRHAKKYSGDARFGEACAAGAMPHSKLLKLMKMPARQFSELMDTATESGVLTKSPAAQFNAGGSFVYWLGDTD